MKKYFRFISTKTLSLACVLLLEHISVKISHVSISHWSLVDSGHLYWTVGLLKYSFFKTQRWNEILQYWLYHPSCIPSVLPSMHLFSTNLSFLWLLVTLCPGSFFWSKQCAQPTFRASETCQNINVPENSLLVCDRQEVLGQIL